jgi:hypothetical protein
MEVSYHPLRLFLGIRASDLAAAIFWVAPSASYTVEGNQLRSPPMTT